MTQIWKEDRVIPVTLLKVEEAEKKTLEEAHEGDKITVTGLSRGKGFQGVVKRHGFHGGPKSHGQKDRLRAPGSLGPTAPQRVIKGRKMAGHTGMKKVTTRGLTLASIDLENATLAIKGAVPGMRGTKIEVKQKV